MKIFRSPRTSDSWTKTDEKSLKDRVKNWRPGNWFIVDGTIDKNGERHTDLAIDIDASDVVSLFNALIRHYESEVKRLEELASDRQKTIDTLEMALSKIDKLIVHHRNQAPDVEALVSAVQIIARNYRWLSKEQFRTDRPKLGWISWNSI